MFKHTWLWITKSTELPVPYWRCAKCGLCINKDPDVLGCPWES